MSEWQTIRFGGSNATEDTTYEFTNITAVELHSEPVKSPDRAVAMAKAALTVYGPLSEIERALANATVSPITDREKMIRRGQKLIPYPTTRKVMEIWIDKFGIDTVGFLLDSLEAGRAGQAPSR